MLRIACVAAACLLSACAVAPVEEAPELPVTRWDHRPEATQWTEATLAALRGQGATLSSMVPSDIDYYCPGYEDATPENRKAFWVGLFSALAFHESTWNPSAVGGGGLWYGLVQIDPRTARGYGCEAQTGNALKDGAKNLQCAVRIAAHQVARRGDVSNGMKDWGPFHSSTKRADMASFTRSQSYCRPEPETAASRVSTFLKAGG